MQQIKTYPSGMRLVVEHMQNFDSVSFNLFVNVGSVNEDDTNRGISHFIEHMLFKGTTRRSGVEIVTRLDAIGASVNAYTSKKETVYYTKSTKESLGECVDILSDMYFNSLFEKKEMIREKKVVQEEIAMYKDNPSAVADELANKAFYEGTPMEKDIAGTKGSVSALTREKVEEYMKKYYIPSNLILSFSGNITLEEASVYAQNYFENNFTTKGQPLLIKTPNNLVIPKARYVKAFKDNEQAQIVITHPSINIHDTRRHALTILNLIWGGGMSSRLFQTIREKLGLVYSVYSGTESSNYGGSINIYLGTTIKNIPIAITALKKAIETLAKEGVEQKEVADAKTNIINNLKLKYENTSYVSLFNAKMLSVYGFVYSKEDIIKNIDAVKKEEVDALAKEIYLRDNFVISMVGKDLSLNLLKEFKKS